jgi:hypothetical protein
MKENIGDTTWVGIRGACTFDECRFNELLAREYGQYIYHKSKSISFGIDGRSYRFKKTDSKSGGKSLQEFEKLVRAYGIKVI